MKMNRITIMGVLAALALIMTPGFTAQAASVDSEVIGGASDSTPQIVDSDTSLDVAGTVGDIETPDTEVEDDVSEIETPDVEVEDDVGEIEAPDVEDIDVADAGDIEMPDIEAPEIETPDIEAPEIEAPEVETPELGE